MDGVISAGESKRSMLTAELQTWRKGVQEKIEATLKSGNLGVGEAEIESSKPRADKKELASWRLVAVSQRPSSAIGWKR